MLTLFLTISIILAIAFIIILMASIMSKKSMLDREKSSPFECGFDPFSNSRIPFSLRFFMIAIIFLIFDVEIAILLPMPMISKIMSLKPWSLISLVFILTLLIGLYHEWNFGALDWS